MGKGLCTHAATFPKTLPSTSLQPSSTIGFSLQNYEISLSHALNPSPLQGRSFSQRSTINWELFKLHYSHQLRRFPLPSSSSTATLLVPPYKSTRSDRDNAMRFPHHQHGGTALLPPAASRAACSGGKDSSAASSPQKGASGAASSPETSPATSPTRAVPAWRTPNGLAETPTRPC